MPISQTRKVRPQEGTQSRWAGPGPHTRLTSPTKAAARSGPAESPTGGPHSFLRRREVVSRSLFSSKRRGLQKIRLMVSQPHGARHRDKTTEEKHRSPLLPGLLEWGDISSCLMNPMIHPACAVTITIAVVTIILVACNLPGDGKGPRLCSPSYDGERGSERSRHLA